MHQPEIITFQVRLEAFLFLGKEYHNGVAFDVWGDFDRSGGWDANRKYGKHPYAGQCMVVNHNDNPDHEIYMPGVIVEKVDEVPTGFAVKQFPARDYIVVTHEWVSSEQGMSEIGRIDEYVNDRENFQVPEGYQRYDEANGSVEVKFPLKIEFAHTDPYQRFRWENWVPIINV